MTPRHFPPGPVYLFLGLFLLNGYRTEAATGPREVETALPLPRLKVPGYAPLLKVGEFRLRQSRFAAAAVSDGRYIFVIGGLDHMGKLLDTIERFDPQTGISEEFAKLQTARLWHRAVLHAGKIYVIGGCTTDLKVNPRRLTEINLRTRTLAMDIPDDPVETPSMESLIPVNSMEILDLTTKRVLPGRHLPEPRLEFGCVVLGEEIFVIGGSRLHGNRSTRTNTVQIYSFVTGQWRDGLPMPTPREAQAAVVDGPFIVVPGGYNGSLALDRVEAFDPRENKWIVLPPLCRSCSAHSLVFMGHYLFLFGNYSVPEELIAYDLFTKKSETFTLQYKPARHTAAVCLDGKIYVIGGRMTKDAEPLDYVQVFAPPPRRQSP